MSNWDLTNLFKTVQDWEQAYSDIETKIDVLANFQGKLNEYNTFLEYYTLQDSVVKNALKVYQYASLQSDLDKRNVEDVSRVQRVGLLFSKLNTATSWESPELIDLGKEKVVEFVERNELLKTYDFSFEKLFHSQNHILDSDKELLLSNFSQIVENGKSLYTSLAVADLLNEEVTLSTNETITVTHGNYRSYLSELDNQEDRRFVFEAFYQHFRNNKNTFASIYNGILQSDLASMKSRKYNSTLESYLDGNKIPKEVYTSLVEVAKENTEPIKRYYEIRKNYFNLEEHHTYDRFLQMASTDASYTYEESKELFFKSIEKYSTEFQEKAFEALKDGYVDVYEKEGKNTGAYSSSVTDEHPFIMLNHSDTLNDAFTLAHEAGHSMHSLYAQDAQPGPKQNYTIFVAEIASTFNEHNLLDYCINNGSLSKEDKIVLLQQSIDDILGTFYRQTLFAAYELEAHKLVENNQPITHESLSNIMIDLYKLFYDIDISQENGKELVWAYIPHFFHTPFYVYQYATSFATSLKLYENVKNGVEGALENHINLLKSGGSDFPINQVKAAGVDLTKKDAFMAVVNRLTNLIDELELAIKS